MSNFLTAKQISAVAVDLLARNLVLPNTVTRNSANEFAGDNGDTVTVRVRQPGEARTQATPGAQITYDDINEVAVDVQLSHLYHATKITDEALSLELVDFASQVTAIQVDAVATRAEDQLAGVMNGLSTDESIASNGSDVGDKILEAREALGAANVPAGDRFLAVSPQVATFLLNEDKFVKVNESGTDSALRDAIIGRLYGFTVVESNALASGTAVAYHRSGFVFANRVPVAPRGANDSASASSGGVGLRQIFQYSPDHLSDASVISTFAGAAAVEGEDATPDSPRIFKLSTSA